MNPNLLAQLPPELARQVVVEFVQLESKHQAELLKIRGSIKRETDKFRLVTDNQTHLRLIERLCKI